MSKQNSKSPSAAQLEILNILINSQEPLSAAEVWAAVSEARELSRATVSTQLDRMEKAGWVHREGDGRAARYAAVRSAEEAKLGIAKSFLGRFFDSKLSNLVLSLVDQEVDSAELARLRKILDDAEARQREDQP